MSQMILTTSNMQIARSNCPEELHHMDQILFPNGERSVQDPYMSADDAEEAIKRFLETMFHRGTITGNLKMFVDTFSMGAFSIDDNESVRRCISMIASHESELRLAIHKAYADDKGHNGSVLGGFPFSIIVSAVTLVGFMMSTAGKTLAVAKETLHSSNNPSKGGSGLLIAILTLVIAGGIVAGRAFKNNKNDKVEDNHQYQSSQATGAKPPISKKEALEVLDLLVAIAAIYRVCEQ